ncbi:M17 family peptidase N-terminal domain-containing protein [Shigella flexneri]
MSDGLSAPCSPWRTGRQNEANPVAAPCSERPVEHILLIGCGKERELDERQYKQVIQKTINTLNDTGSMEAVCFLTELHVKGRNTYWKSTSGRRNRKKRASTALIGFNQSEARRAA